MLKNNRFVLKYCQMPALEKQSMVLDHVRIQWDKQITFHQHDFWELSYIVVGSGMRMVDNMMEPFTAGEIVLLPPNIAHCWSFDEHVSDADGKIENITLFFNGDLLNKMAAAFPELLPYMKEMRQYQKANRYSGQTLNRIQTILIKMLAEDEVERISSLIRIFPLLCNQHDAEKLTAHFNFEKRNPKLQQVYSYVMNNYQSEIKIEELADLVGMERSSFCTFFKRMSGKTFVTFLVEYRVESSCQMLRATTASVAEVCLASGFNDVPYYHRVFKKIKGITPTAFRQLSLVGMP